MDAPVINVDRLTDADTIALLQEHLQSMTLYSPPESIHALDLQQLRTPDLTFWTARVRGELAGFGALKELDRQHGEIKSMRTASHFQRRGIARSLLQHVLEVARQRGYRRLSLETGTHAAFQPAVGLYRQHGFESCGPFGAYQYDPYSMFMTRQL